MRSFIDLFILISKFCLACACVLFHFACFVISFFNFRLIGCLNLFLEQEAFFSGKHQSWTMNKSVLCGLTVMAIIRVINPLSHLNACVSYFWLLLFGFCLFVCLFVLFVFVFVSFLLWVF